MNTVAAIVYWVIVTIWLVIILTLISFYIANRKIFGTTRLLLLVLALDAIRNVIENIYFGLYFGSKYGLFSGSIELLLGKPILLILPKFGNVAAGCLVLGLLLFRWLPEAIRERTSTEQHTQYLHFLATTDSLTGLRNRGDFMAVAEAEWRLYQEDRRALSLLIIDIDFFKSVNDRYGHHIGDQVIMMVARLCRTRKREADVAGRLGGEEFGILLRNSGLAMAHSFAERLRGLVASEAVTIGEDQLSVTVSVGVSSALQAQSITDFFKKADSALYHAKRSGRNRVCIFGNPEKPPDGVAAMT